MASSYLDYDPFDVEMPDSPTSRNNRNAPRVIKRIEIALQHPGSTRSYHTRDISYIGVFVECPEPLPLRKLVRFQADLEDGREPLQMLGVVAHRINSADAIDSGREPGMGIHLFAIGPESRSIWRHFVRTEYDKDPSARDAIRRQEYPRVRMHFPTVNEMAAFARGPLATGDVFVRAADLYQQGTRVWLESVHPQTNELCGTEAIVMEFVEAPRQKRGLRLQILAPDEASRELAEFSQ